jgi:hypothetical protein
MGAEHEDGKRWGRTINGYFTGPAILVFGCLILKLIWVALVLFAVFCVLLLTSGVLRVFHLLPALTRYLIITAPLVFVIGWIIGWVDAGEATAITLICIYFLLQLISNLSIASYIEKHQASE